MSKDTNTAPATKADIAELRSMMVEFRDSNQEWKNEMLTAFDEFKDDAIRHFEILFENFRHDIVGAFSDRYESLREVQRGHGRRLNRLETKCDIKV